MESMARKTFEMENKIQEVDPDQIYRFDEAAQEAILDAGPWKRDPHYFKKVSISAVALIKMVMHARSGGRIEVMGLLQGKIDGDTFIIMDTFALPVEGTETRVNAGHQANEYMVNYMEAVAQAGRQENACGWYHSHPGYGCWLSGIDVNTQMLYQQHQEPWLAIVIDPTKTVSAGKVAIGAFRTFPANYTPPDAAPSEYQNIPMEKIEDFGVHAQKYYQLEVSFFKSSLDRQLLALLWNQYWVSTLSSSPLLQNREYTTNQIVDLAFKLEQAETSLAHSARSGMLEPRKEESALSKVAKDGSSTAVEQLNGLLSQVVKDLLFNRAHCCRPNASSSSSSSS
eukprot:GILI01011991.1.p1 GENE.GILI01011991.1~~GILI01011991.1.p1  ORF type:complete len:340 (-),score=98.97 GILI01011991.1:85-1104(-)